MYEWLTSRWQAIIEPSDELLHSCLQYILWILRTVCAFFVCFVVVVESWLIQPVPFRVTSLTLGLLYYCPNTSVATLKNIGKCIRWVHTDHTKMGKVIRVTAMVFTKDTEDKLQQYVCSWYWEIYTSWCPSPIAKDLELSSYYFLMVFFFFDILGNIFILNLEHLQHIPLLSPWQPFRFCVYNHSKTNHNKTCMTIKLLTYFMGYTVLLYTGVQDCYNLWCFCLHYYPCCLY